MDAVTLPAKWQEWRIVEALGEGSFGKVYRAEKDDGIVRSVSAIKVVEIAADNANMAGLSRRCRSEAAVREYLWSVVDHCAEEIRTMYRLQGESNIVSIQDHAIEELEGRIGWRLFIRMEYLQGFNDYLTTHEFTQRDIIRMGISLCGALEKCEKLNILHRDIKPENIFVSSSGEFKLGDFGISRVLEETRVNLTSEGTFGTIAPETYKGQPCGKEADIYSLGLVLYTLANKNCEPFIDIEKQLPSYGELQDAFERRIKGEPLPPPVDASPALARVLLKACAYKPSARYRTAADFRAALLPLARERRRFPIRWVALASALVALGVASAKWIVPRLTRGALPPRAVEATDAPAPEASEAPTAEASEAPTAEASEAPTPEASEAPTPEASEAPAPRSIRDCIPTEKYTAVAGRDDIFRELREGPSGEMLVYSQIILRPEEAVSSTDAVGKALARDMSSGKFTDVGKTRALREEDPSVWVRQGKWTDNKEQGWRCEAGAIYNADAGRLQPAVLMVFEAQEQEYIDAAFESFEAMLLKAAGG